MTPANEIFFDFVCPYAWRGLELAQVLRKAGEQEFKLRHFSLAQSNHEDNAGKDEPVWWLTDQPLAEAAPSDQKLPEKDEAKKRHMAFVQSSLLTFLAAEAAARQGEEASWDFSLAVFRAHHEDSKPLNEATIMEAAQTAGLNLEQFAADREDEQGLRARLRSELTEAAEIGVFGTPTFILPGGEAAYFRFENLTRDLETARQWWKLYGEVLNADAGIATIKRAKNRPAKKA